MIERAVESTLVLGLGNLLCGDDGLGIVAVEALRRRYDFEPALSLVDGGTLGLALLPTLEEADSVWILDAIAADAPAGTVVALEGESVEPALRERLSPHQIGVADLLDALHWRDTWPSHLRVLGIVPESMGLRIGLSDPVARSLDRLVAVTIRELARVGHVATKRSDVELTVPVHEERPHSHDDLLARALGL